jgi:membrane associated rhomboid family serine protease
VGCSVSSPAHFSAWFFLGAWFLYQLIEANFGMFSARANGGGVAFFAHVGGFLFGLIVTLVALPWRTGRRGRGPRRTRRCARLAWLIPPCPLRTPSKERS